jgi:hypothetical protein
MYVFVQGSQQTSLLYVPETDRLIFAAAGKRASIRAKSDGPNMIGMRQEYLEAITAFAIPETSGQIVAPTGQEATIGIIVYRPDVMAVAGQDSRWENLRVIQVKRASTVPLADGA